MLRYVATPFEGILVPKYFSAAVSNFFIILSQSITRTLHFVLGFLCGFIFMTVRSTVELPFHLCEKKS
jgi:hypothetical protein